MDKGTLALRSALALILITFCAPLGGMFSRPGAWFNKGGDAASLTLDPSPRYWG